MRAPVVPEPHALRGITLKVGSVMAFVGMASFIKASGDVPPGQMVFFRSFFAFIPVIVFLAWRRELAVAFRTARPMGHVMRGLVGVSSMGLGFFALYRLPLPEWIAINYCQPLIVVVFSAVFLREPVRIFRWSAVIIGLIGVTIISWPKLTLFTGDGEFGHEEAVGVIALFLSAAVSATAMMLTRHLVLTERSSTIVLWFATTSTIAGLLTIPFGWVGVTPSQAAFLVSAGLCGGIGQILLTESYRHADMSTIAPFEYTSMLLAIAIGYLAFSDVPTVHTVVGGSIVVWSGLFIIWREQKLGLRRDAENKVSPPEG